MQFTALIVDDAAIARDSLRAGVLSILPLAQVYEASSALEAGRFLLKAVPDVLFLDLNMPGVSGLTFLERLDQILGGRKAPIIVSISADLSEETMEKLKRRGAYDVLPKPFRPVEIADVLLRVLEMHRSRDVLVVDDSSTVRLLVTRVLSRSRFTFKVEDSPDAETALTMLRRKAYDIVFMDLNMPGMDGLEAAGEILYSRPQTHIIMMSGEGDDQARRAAAHIGVEFFLKKPFYAGDVDAVLHTVFKLHESKFVHAAQPDFFGAPRSGDTPLEDW